MRKIQNTIQTATIATIVYLAFVNSFKNETKTEKIFSDYKSDRLKENVLRILCFGDSLTKGFFGIPNKYYPYTNKLQELLTKHYGDNITVFNMGKGAERITNEMIRRLDKELQTRSYDLILILGGVNDLVKLNVIDKVDLFQSIKKIHDAAHAHGIKTIAMTIMEAHVKAEKLKYVNQREFDVIRRRVNRKIKKYLPSSMTDVCDTAKLFPYEKLSALAKQKLWSRDAVHLTKDGYNKLGTIIFNCIRKYFEK